MNSTTFNRNKVSEYCREHLHEFTNELRDGASTALTSWFGRIVFLLLALSSILNYVDASARDNPYAVYLLFAYGIALLTLALYPASILVFSSIEKYSPLILDFLCLFGIIGFFITLRFLFLGAVSVAELQSLRPLFGQINFVLFFAISFSYHASYLTTFIRNVVLTAIFAMSLYFLGTAPTTVELVLVAQGFLGGTLVSWFFFESIRARFYLKSTDADSREHLHKQLSKLVYPHQLERIKLGDELEDTMPLKEGKAIINVFDVQRSSEIRHEKTQEFFLGVFHEFMEICMKGYEHNPLRSRAFRLKETGDGFISAVGYPFLPVDSRSLADSAVSTALLMFEAFNAEVKKFNYSRPIKGSMGLAYNFVQGTFQSSGIRSYDLYGESLVQASKYEELRKQPLLWEIFSSHAKEMGLSDFNILIMQEVVYNSLSPAYRDIFSEIDLKDNDLIKHDFQMMYDQDARFIYYHVLA